MERLAPRAGRVCHLEVGEGGVDDRAVAVRLGRQHPLAVGVVGEGRRLIVGAHRRQPPLHVEGVVVGQDAALIFAVQVAPRVVAVNALRFESALECSLLTSTYRLGPKVVLHLLY